MLICLILIDSFYLILDRILVFSFKYVLKLFNPVLQMARTRQTARKRTGGRAFARRTVPAPAEPVPAPAPAPVPAQPEEEVEEVPGRDYFFDEDQEGNIREVDADGNIQPSLPSPMPAHDLGPPLAYFEAQVPATAVAEGGQEEEPLEMSEDEAPAPPPAPPAPAASAPAPAGGDPEGPEDPDDEDDDEDPPEERGLYCVYTSTHEEGHFPLLLRDTLEELHNPVAPLYKTRHYEDPALGDYFVTRVHIRVDTGPRGMMTVSAHDSSTPMATYRASVSHAAMRALWSLNHTNRRDLESTDYQHLPRRARGTEHTELTLGEDEENRVNVTVRALAGVDTDLRNVVNQLDDTQDRLREAHHRIRQLEAQLAGEAPPPVPEGEPPHPALSPPRKRLRFGDRGYQNRFY